MYQSLWSSEMKKAYISLDDVLIFHVSCINPLESLIYLLLQRQYIMPRILLHVTGEEMYFTLVVKTIKDL